MKRKTCITVSFVMVVFMVFSAMSLAVTGATKSTVARVEYNPNSPTGGLKIPLSSKPITVTVLAPDGDWYNKDTWIVTKEIKKKLNLDIKLTKYGAVYGDKLKMLIATNNLPDFFSTATLTYNTLDKMAKAGMLVPLDKYMDGMPNIRNYFQEHPEVKANLTCVDGHIYNTWIGGYYAPYGVSDGWIYKPDVFKQYKVETKFDTIDNFYKTLVKIRDANPKAYPLLNRWGANHVLSFFAHSYNTGGDFTTGMYYNIAAKEWRYGFIESNYMEMLRFVDKLQKEKILHPEWPTMEADLYFKTVYATPYEGGAVLNESPAWMQKDGYRGGGLNYEPFPPPKPSVPGGNQKIICTGLVLTEGAGEAVSSKSKYPEIIMKYLDYRVSKEGKLFSYFGVEGKSYTKGANGVITPLGGKPNTNDWLEITIKKFGFSSWGLISEPPQEFNDAYVDKDHARGQAALKQYSEFNARPRISFTDFENDFISVKLASIDKFCTENIVKFATGKRPFSEWNAYVNEVKKMGVEDIVKIYKTAWTRKNK